jgi:superfamily II DNA or RNA helicase
MKKDKLKESESCKLILGTYPMAKEGLDIPTLNCLILGTPISDIVQSIGRIDRVKHINITPLIIDIVDDFSIFSNQSRKRFALFKKKNYELEDIQFNLDTYKYGIKKTYNFHNCKNKNTDSDEGSIVESDESVDTEYNNIDPKTNKKKPGIKTNKIDGKKDTDKIDVDNIFKQFAFSV